MPLLKWSSTKCLATRHPVLTMFVVSILSSIATLARGQYQINDLVPIGDPSYYFKYCLLPYQDASLGLSNSHPVPSLCDLGALASVTNSWFAQAFLRVFPLFLAGALMYFLLRRLGNRPPLALFGGVLYSLSPAIMDQVSLGGPGIALTAAALPGVAFAVVPCKSSSSLRDGLFSGALLAFVTIFNPQAPLILMLPLVPFAVQSLLSEGIRRVISSAAGFALAFAIGVAPVALLASATRSDIIVHKAAILHTVATAIAGGSFIDLAKPYLYVGMLPACIAVLTTLFIRGLGTAREKAASASFFLILFFWWIYHETGNHLVDAIPALGLFQDEIKFGVMLGLPIVILSLALLRMVEEGRFGALRPLGTGLAVGFIVTTLLVPAIIWHKAALLRGEIGPAREFVLSPVYFSALQAIHHRDRNISSYRILWLPQDQQNNHALSVIDPQSLFYRDDLDGLAKAAILTAEANIVAGQPRSIAPLLGELSVKYIVVNRSYLGDPAAPWQTGSRMIAAIGDLELLSGAPIEYLRIIHDCPKLLPIIDGPGYEIYQNLDWKPIVQRFAGIARLDYDATPSKLLGVSPVFWGTRVAWVKETNRAVHLQAADENARPQSVGQLIRSGPWQCGPGCLATKNEIRIAATRRVSWTPASSDFPVRAGQSYIASVLMAYSNVIASHVKIVWLGTGTAIRDPLYLVNGRSGSGSANASRWVVAPPGAVVARILLMGGWRENARASGYTKFSKPLIRVAKAPVALTQAAQQPNVINTLQSEFPNLLVEPSARITGASIGGLKLPLLSFSRGGQKTYANRTLRVLTSDDIRLDGSWGIEAIPSYGTLESYSSSGNGDSITIPWAELEEMPKGSSVVWLEYDAPLYEDGGQPIVSRQVVATRTDVRISCRRLKCVIANIVAAPPLPVGPTIIRIAWSFGQGLLPSDDKVARIRIEGDWATMLAAAPEAKVSYANNQITRVRFAALIVSHLWIACCIIFGMPGRRRRITLLGVKL